MSTPGVPGGALPFSGPLDLAAINTEFGLGTDLNQYQGVKWYYDGNLTYGFFGNNTIKVSDFRGKRATDPAGGGAYFSNTVGSGNYTTTLYRNSFTIEIWGGGGSGGGGNGGAGGKGGDSSTLGVTAGGGAGGGAGNIPVPPPPVVVGTDGRGGRDQVPTGYIGAYFNTNAPAGYNTAFINADGSLTAASVSDITAARNAGNLPDD
jgi:hypothetical protein